MAFVTAQFSMGTIQLETGFIVVEVPGLPVAHVVASFACRSQATLVNIFLLMARPAIRFCILEGRGEMAFFTLN